MRRFLHTLLVAAVAVSAFAACSRDDGRMKILKVYNWADYIDEDLIEEFEDWYEEQTGERVNVIYQLFDINEIMLAKIERGHEDYDVVCPSEYIIERMLRNDLLLPIDRDFGDTPDYTRNVSPYIIDRFDKIDGSGKNANDYSVGYMWGTTGILYNPKYVTDDEASSWGVLRNEKFKGKILVKDAFRDVYTPVLVYLKQEELARGEVTLEELMYDSSDESIALVEEYLKGVKRLVAGWEADFGKEIMTKEKAWLNLSWSGDAVWAIDEAASIGVELDYRVPVEGSVVWFDGWVIPKYAKNVKAARYFINYMCRSESAIRNMDAIGYVSAIATPEVMEAQIDEQIEEPSDLSYFFGEEAKNIRINNVQYPDRSTIERCAMMHDSGARTEQMLEMWSRVKGDNVDTGILMVIFVTLLGLFVLAVVRKIKKHRRAKRHRRLRKKRR